MQRSGNEGAESPFWVHTNWSQFGFTPTHDQFNIYENAPNSHNIDHVQLRRSYPAPASTASVVQGSIYFGSADTIYAVNGKDGKLAWQYKTG